MLYVCTKSALDNFPKSLNGLYNRDYIDIGFDELMEVCITIMIKKDHLVTFVSGQVEPLR